jgi:hypothetical protein
MTRLKNISKTPNKYLSNPGFPGPTGVGGVGVGGSQDLKTHRQKQFPEAPVSTTANGGCPLKNLNSTFTSSSNEGQE